LRSIWNIYSEEGIVLLGRGISMVKLWNGLDHTKEQEILEKLLQNGITCFVKEDGAGEYMRIAMGFSLSGRNIYVDEKDAKKASRLLGEMKAQWNLEQMQEGWEVEEENLKLPWFRRREIVARLILGAVVIFMILTIFL
jgi:hypothetical protein